MSELPRFDYSGFEDGYYQKVLESGHPIRRAWHQQKFERVLSCLPSGHQISLLDIGCFAGSFLAMVPEERFARQVGVDIIAKQIDYANAHFANAQRRFIYVKGLEDLDVSMPPFDCITIIEVIEHLTAEEIRVLLKKASDLLKPGGTLIITTPNYCSAWPLVEILVNKFGGVTYEEQHITRFTFFNFCRRLAKICPDVYPQFSLNFLTTTHFITPFLAGLSLRGSHAMSKLIDHRRWRNPFGNLILASMQKRGPHCLVSPSFRDHT